MRPGGRDPVSKSSRSSDLQTISILCFQRTQHNDKRFRFFLQIAVGTICSPECPIRSNIIEHEYTHTEGNTPAHTHTHTQTVENIHNKIKTPPSCYMLHSGFRNILIVLNHKQQHQNCQTEQTEHTSKML